MNMVGWTMYRALMFFLYLQTHHMFSQGVLTHVWYNDYKSIHRNVTASVESAAHRLHRQPALLRGWILCCQRWAGENNARTCNWRPAFIFISQTEWVCGCARRCCAKCKLTGWKWLKTKAGLSSFAILNSGNMAEAIRTCYCNCVQFMKHCTQYLFPLHSREKPVPYHWMHTVHLCLNTEVRGKQTVRASHVCSTAPFSSTRPVCTSSVD